MPYGKGTRLPGETASKLGHITIINSEWVKSLVEDFEAVYKNEGKIDESSWTEVDLKNAPSLKQIWAVDGSFVTINTSSKPPKEMTFVKTALLTIDKTRLDNVDKVHPHPLMLQQILKDSAVFHSTVFPLKNVKSSLGSNYDAVRHIVKDSIKVDEGGRFYETLKWIAYQKWNTEPHRSPSFACPHCHHELDQGLSYDSDDGQCNNCQKEVFLTDMIGFHLDMDENSAPETVASSYMLIMEHLMLFTPIRLLWTHSDKSIVSNTLFIKDGPLTLRSQYSKLVPNIRAFLQKAKDLKRPIHIIGQEKSGAFLDHLSSIAHLVPPHSRNENLRYFVLSHGYVRKEVYRSPDLSNPYGKRTNWGEKVFVKVDPGSYIVINVPTGDYLDNDDSPEKSDLIGIERILATLPSLLSSKFEGGLYPIELANGIASLSNYPSASILKNFAH